MKLKRILLLIFFLIAGTVAGALIASLCLEIPALSWLGFSRTVGFNPSSPMMLDLSVVKFSFGFSVSISVAQVLTIGLCIFLYNLVIRRRK